MKKGYILSLLSVGLLVGFAGCGKKKQKAAKYSNKSDVTTNIDIPVAQSEIRSIFDEDVNGFNLADSSEAKTLKTASIDGIDTTIDATEVQVQDYGWAEEVGETADFKTVYFDFDKYTVRADQEENLNYNIELAKKMIEESKSLDKEMPMVVIDGHACDSAGSRVYNLALSEKRAKVLADKFVDAGIERANIKIVGRGAEMPAIVDGKPCTGDKAQQWPNRRDTLHIMYS